MSKVKQWVMAVVLIVCVLGVSAPAMATKSSGVDSAARARIQENYGKLPLYFIRNNGQMNKEVKFYDKGNGHSTFFTEKGIYLQLSREQKSQLIKLLPQGANKTPEIVAEGIQKGKVNYFVGKKDNWKTNIPTYQAVIYKGIYDGVDMKFYGNNRQLEYDIIVKPGVDPSQVVLSYERIESLEITATGELKIVLKDGGFLTQKAPYIYQEIDGKRVEIAGRFKILASQSSYGFEVASYNKNYPLIIDPILVYSTYLGGSGTDSGIGIAVDTAGNAYVTGNAASTDFPSAFPVQGSNAGGLYDTFVTKIDASGSSISYSTYLGGTGDEWINEITVDAGGNAYISGSTNSTDYPTASAIQGSFAGGTTDVFITKINAAGSALSYSTYLGGSAQDGSGGIAVDASGNAYITGNTYSTDFPTASAYQGSLVGGPNDAFIAKINAAGTALTYSTYLGGSGGDSSEAIAIDNTGNAYITGNIYSTDFPTASAIQGSKGGGINDAFITKIDSTGSSITYSTYLGGSGNDSAGSIAVDATGNAYVAGRSTSTDFPTASAIQGSYAGVEDAFVTKINAAGSSFSYSTYLGGSGEDWCTGLAVDSAGNAYVTGHTASSTDFPTASPIQAAFGGGTDDAFITKINAAGSGLSYSTFLGGSGEDWTNDLAIDSSGNAYITGRTASSDFPTASPYQGSFAGGTHDAFVAKIVEASVTATPDNPTPLPGGSVCIQTDMAGVNDLYATSFDMVYSNTVVTFNNATEGSFLNNNGSDSTSMQAALLNGAEGQLVVGISRLGNIGGVTGAGSLANICYDVVGAACSSSDISFSNTYLEGPTQGSAITASWGTASISVALPDATALTPSDPGTHDRIDLSWTAAAGATSYDIYRSDSSGSGFALIGNTAGTTYQDSDCIIPTLNYYYYVVAKVGSCVSNPTAESTGTAAGLLGDINNDGRVDGRDLSRLARDWGATPPTDCLVDLNRDDIIDGGDLSLLAASFGLTLP